MTDILFRSLAVCAFGAHLACGVSVSGAPSDAKEILEEAGIRGGLVLHLGCGDGSLTWALRTGEEGLVLGLSSDPEEVARARQTVRSKGLYGPVSIDRISGDRLPCVDNLVNLVVSEDPGGVPMEEILRVLAPGGVALLRRSGAWEKTVKPRPAEIDEWTHYLHSADNNAVAADSVVGPPRRLQWVAHPRWSRHHDKMSSISAVVSAAGRIFSIVDEGAPAAIVLPAEWKLVARDAFNGVLLWRKTIPEWHPHLWPLKSGPAQLPRRLVAAGDSVYVTLGIRAPVVELDAATGVLRRTFAGTEAAEEILVHDGTLLALVNDAADRTGDSRAVEGKGTGTVRRVRGNRRWDEEPARRIAAFEVADGRKRWQYESAVMPNTLTMTGGQVFFYDGEKVVALEVQEGKETWISTALPRPPKIPSNFTPTLVCVKGVVLFSGGENAAGAAGWPVTIDTLTALDAATGKELWKGAHPNSGYKSPEDVLVLGDVVWMGQTTSGDSLGERGNAPLPDDEFPFGVMIGYDLRTGKVRGKFTPDVKTYWFHHRCYRAKATENYLLVSRTGIEFVDPKKETWEIHHWVRGACLYGVMPANGLTYAPPHPCACYPEAKLNGYNALAPVARTLPREPPVDALEKGPAWPAVDAAGPGAADWPTFRHDAQRSGCASSVVPPNPRRKWTTALGGRLTAPVSGYGKVLLAAVDAHEIHCLEAVSGRKLWSYTAGGRIDSAPTLHNGTACFGSADGTVTCLRLSDGALVWRFLAAPGDLRTVAYGQVESLWPVHGSVLIRDDVLHFVAGRSMYLDGGLLYFRLDPATGKVLGYRVFDDSHPEKEGSLMQEIRHLTMPVGLPDVLSSDGKHIYMRSQMMSMEGERQGVAVQGTQKGEGRHLFCPAGFLDDTWWHRSYWLYGRSFSGGYGGYFGAGKHTAAGKMLVFNGEKVFGYGRKPQYYRWTTPMEYQLFSAPKDADAHTPAPPEKGKRRSNYHVKHDWVREIPVWVRAMVLSEQTLIVAGPPDLIDEEEAARKKGEESMGRLLADQLSALRGGGGALMKAFSTETGEPLWSIDLASPPVFDGMAAADGRLFLATLAGEVVCFSGEEDSLAETGHN